jgi:hypothetical protein
MDSNLNLPTCVSVLLVMRIYALYFRNRWILFIVTLEFVAGFILACVSAAVDDPKYLCVDFASGLLLNCCLELPQQILRNGQSPPSFLAPDLIVIGIRTLLSSGVVVSVRSAKLCSTSITRFVSARSGFLWPPGLRPHRFCSHNGPFDKTVDA